jgi:hypothetical protein
VRQRGRGHLGPPTTEISVARCMDINRQSMAHLVARQRGDCKCLVGTMLHFYMSVLTCAILTRSKRSDNGDSHPAHPLSGGDYAGLAGRGQSPLSSAVCHALVNRSKIDDEAEGDRRQRASRGYPPSRRCGARPLRVPRTRYVTSRPSFGAGARDSPAVGAGVDLAIGRP